MCLVVLLATYFRFTRAHLVVYHLLCQEICLYVNNYIVVTLYLLLRRNSMMMPVESSGSCWTLIENLYSSGVARGCRGCSSLDPRPIRLQLNARSPTRPGIDCIWA